MNRDEQATFDRGVHSSFRVGCFYALLNVLRAPLAKYVGERREEGPLLALDREQRHKNIRKAGVKTLIQFVKDHWANHLRLVCPPSLLKDLKTLDLVQSRFIFSGVVGQQVIDDGIKAIDRLLSTLAADDETLRRVCIIKESLLFDHEQLCSVHLDKPSSPNPTSSSNENDSDYSRTREEDESSMGDASRQASAQPCSLSGSVTITEEQTDSIQPGDSEIENEMTASVPFDQAFDAEKRVTSPVSESSQGSSSPAEDLVPIQSSDPEERESCEVPVGNAVHAPNNDHDEVDENSTNQEDHPDLNSFDNSVLFGDSDRAEPQSTPAASATSAPCGDAHDIQKMFVDGTKPVVSEKTTLLSSTAQLLAQDAVRLVELGRYAQAAGLFSRAIELYTSDGMMQPAATMFVQRGECYFALGNHTKAYEDADQGLSLRQCKFTEASRLRIRTLVAMGRYSDALETCVLALTASPTEPDLIKTQAKLADQVITINVGQGTPARRRSLTQQGLTQFRESNITVAVLTFTVALLHAGTHMQAASMYLHRARCYIQLKQYRSAVQDASVALVVQEMKVTASELLCRALVAVGNVDAASIICSSALEKLPDDASLLKIRDDIEKSRKFEGSESPVSNQVEQSELWELKLKTFIHEGLTLMAGSRHEAAAKAFDNALLLLDSITESTEAGVIISKKVNVLGHKARLACQDFSSALDSARRGLSMDPKWTEGYRLLCRALVALGRWSEALKACKSVFARCPRDSTFRDLQQEIADKIAANNGAASRSTSNQGDAWQVRVRELVHQGLNLSRKKKYTGAEARLTQALSVLDGLPSEITDEAGIARAKLFGHRARCRLAMKQYAGAARDARDGVACQPEWVDGFRLLCHALMGQAEWDKSMEACKQVLTRVPHDLALKETERELLVKCGRNGEYQAAEHVT